MRTLLKITMPPEPANKAIKDGSLPKLFQTLTESVHPESSYYYSENGKRTAFFVFDMKDASQIPSLCEPFFMSLNADVSFYPVMNSEELKAGLEKAMRNIGRLPVGV